jgi:transposase, IS30 family
LGRSVSTICDEINRNKTKRGVYNSNIAKQKAYVRRKYAKYQGMKIVGDSKLHAFVEQALLEGRSPASISGRIGEQEKHLTSISTESIERFLKSVYGRKIESLRNKQKKKKRRTHRVRSKTLDGRRFIDVRPRSIDTRQRVGDAEADFIVSGKTGAGHLLTVADRKLRTTFIEKVFPVTIKNVHRAFKRIKKRYPELRTITTDNDLLLAHHKQLEQELGITIYFCHPYHSWEKGTIENTNGVIRKYIPKGSDLSKYSSRFIRSVEEKLNNRYMECLKYRTPKEALELHRKRKIAARKRRGIM